MRPRLLLMVAVLIPGLLACSGGLEDADLFSRALNLLSHGKYDIYQPSEMVDDNKQLFRRILDAFLGRYEFALPDIFDRPAKRAAAN